jgi:uncharacterized membrane protein
LPSPNVCGPDTHGVFSAGEQRGSANPAIAFEHTMNRKELDAFAAHHRLSRTSIEAAFELANAQPSAADRQRFALRLLRLAGVLSLGAGIVFFIAANWDALAVMGRFALLQTALVLCVAGAIWQPPPQALGRYAVLLAFIVTGGVLALFGQTYQTGADVYELFLTWAALGLLFAIAGQWSVTWAAWTLVLNVALLLFCGWRAESGLLWGLFFGWGLQPSEMMVLAMLANVLLWLAILALQRTRAAALAPSWLGRFVLAWAVGFGTSAGIVVIVRADYDFQYAASSRISLLVSLVVLAGIAIHTLRRRHDVFPLALIAASLIALTSFALAEHLELDELGLFFVLSLWLILSSTASGRWLMKTVRAWRGEASDA